jgi:murein L,D-transpeptidase YafK
MKQRKFLIALGIAGLLLAPMQSCTVLKTNNLETTLSEYNGLVRYALRKSHKENVILINKSKYTLDVLADRKIIKEYPIELGFNPLDDKKMEGDGCTPEGIYSAAKKIPAQQSKYYKAILIDYPTSKNTFRFDQRKVNGTVPPHARIGGLIEIHGTGSGEKGNDKGENWTLGCIALSNKDMDTLYESVRVGTPIVIVKDAKVKYK